MGTPVEWGSLLGQILGIWQSMLLPSWNSINAMITVCPGLLPHSGESPYISVQGRTLVPSLQLEKKASAYIMFVND